MEIVMLFMVMVMMEMVKENSEPHVNTMFMRMLIESCEVGVDLWAHFLFQ